MEPRAVKPARNFRHGFKRASGASPEYVIWNNMRARCNNPRTPHYERYGGRGIKVCNRWNEDFTAFLSDMGCRPSSRHSIERKDNSGDYEPGNCRWATAQEQARNRRSSKIIEVGGVSQTLSEWAEACGISIATIHARLKLGWTPERAVREPLRADSRRRKN